MKNNKEENYKKAENKILSAEEIFDPEQALGGFCEKSGIGSVLTIGFTGEFLFNFYFHLLIALIFNNVVVWFIHRKTSLESTLTDGYLYLCIAIAVCLLSLFGIKYEG